MKQAIKLIVESVFGCDPIADHRQEKERRARQVYAYLLHEHTRMKHEEIAKAISRNRSTVYHCIKTVRETLKRDKHYFGLIDQCERWLLDRANLFKEGRIYWFREKDGEWLPARFIRFFNNRFFWVLLGRGYQEGFYLKDFETDKEINHAEL